MHGTLTERSTRAKVVKEPPRCVKSVRSSPCFPSSQSALARDRIMSHLAIPSPMSLTQFEDRLLDGERWVELIEGRFVQLNPPDDIHGDVVRNLARRLAAYLKKSTDTTACFELPLVIKREPPTVRCPAVSCFRSQSGGRFAETDKVLTESRPLLVIEVASSNERREAMSDRVRAYLDWGVDAVWIIDPVSRHVHQFHGRVLEQMLKETQSLSGLRVLPGFEMPVSDLFRPPDWMKIRKRVDDY